MTITITKTVQINADKCLVDFMHYLREEYPEIGPMDFQSVSAVLQEMSRVNNANLERKEASKRQ